MTPASTARIALITGAAGDIGGAVAERLAADGWSLALTDHPAAATRLAEISGSIRARSTGGGGGRCVVWSAACDVVDREQVGDLVARCCGDLGTPVGLFAGAGVQGSFAALPTIDLAQARRVMDVNVMGVLNVVVDVAAAMVAARLEGAIVTAASMAGVSGAPNMAAYSASKAAVIALTKSAAKDLAPAGIRVNAVSPAFIGPGVMWDAQVAAQAAVGSQYFDTSPQQVAKQMIDMVPMRRYGSPQEVASVVAFLLSNDASYMTGQNLEVSGGSV